MLNSLHLPWMVFPFGCSSSGAAIHTSASTFRPFPPRMMTSWYQEPKSGFQISMSPFARPMARRTGAVLVDLTRLVCEKATALTADTG